MLKVIRISEGCYRATPEAAWSQGFATYGGYVAAAALKAAILEGHDRPLLSAQINFLAPASVDGFEIDIDPLRVGKGTSVIEACVHSNGKLAAKLLFTFGVPRPASVAVSQAVEPSILEEWQSLRDQTADTPTLKGIVPGFLSQFRFRPLRDGKPFSSTPSQDHLIAFKPRFAFDGTWAEYLLLLSDINPPALLMMVDEPCPASTATWMCKLEFPQDHSPAQEWFYVVIHMDTAANGYGQHNTMIFDAEGRHIASNHQLTTVFERDGGAKTLRNLPRRLAFKSGYSLLKAFFAFKGRLKRVSLKLSHPVRQ